uniref:Uncharacterized protein n=1 Tax=Lygus lineolaris TaxID=50650 RepID=A5HMP8_LYGLI|nr:unknown [Lygus lineolaris]
MKSLSLVVFCVTLAAGLAAPAGNGTGNKVEELIDAYLTWADKVSQKADPIVLKDVHKIPIVTLDPPVGILLSAANRTVSGLSTNTVSDLVVENNTAQWRITYPSISGESDYEAIGLFYGRKLSGQGHAKVNLINVTVDTSVTLRNINIRFPLTNTSYLQIAELTQNVSVGAVASNYTGLSVSGLTEDQVTQILNAQMTTTLNLNLPIWERIASESTKCQLNIALIGSTIDDAINWLKKNTPTSSMMQSLMTKFTSL